MVRVHVSPRTDTRRLLGTLDIVPQVNVYFYDLSLSLVKTGKRVRESTGGVQLHGVGVTLLVPPLTRDNRKGSVEGHTLCLVWGWKGSVNRVEFAHVPSTTQAFS